MGNRLTLSETPETLGAVELTSVARGYRVADAMIKKAPSRLLDARAYCPGKFLIVIAGDVASVEESLEAGLREAAEALFGHLFIPNLEADVVAAVNRTGDVRVEETLGVLESFSAVSMIDAADAAAKAADIDIQSISLLEGLGGKAFALFSGELTNVEAAIAAGTTRIPEDMFVGSELIPQISPELAAFYPGVG